MILRHRSVFSSIKSNTLASDKFLRQASSSATPGNTSASGSAGQSAAQDAAGSKGGEGEEGSKAGEGAEERGDEAGAASSVDKKDWVDPTEATEVSGVTPRVLLADDKGLTLLDAETGKVLKEQELAGFKRLSTAGNVVLFVVVTLIVVPISWWFSRREVER